MSAVKVRDAIVQVLLFATLGDAIRSSDYYTREVFRELNSEITDLNAVKIAKPHDPRNPCPWPEYPHVGRRYCERRCSENATEMYRPQWCEQAETQAEITGEDYACICPWRLLRHENGTCVPLSQCSSSAEMPKCSQNETLAECTYEYSCYDSNAPLNPYEFRSTRLMYCSNAARQCICRPNFYRAKETSNLCVRYEDCPLDSVFGRAIRKAVAALPKCPGDYEMPRCGNDCKDPTCAEPTEAVIPASWSGSQIPNISSCLRVCVDEGYTCGCEPGFVRHEGRCIWPDNCPRSSFPECPENEQLNFHGGKTDLYGCPERNCSAAAPKPQQDNGMMMPLPEPSSCTRTYGVQVMLSTPTCWCPNTTHFRNSTGACVTQDECRADPAYRSPKNVVMPSSEAWSTV